MDLHATQNDVILLNIAMSRHAQASTIQRLIDAGANIEYSREHCGQTPLIIAATYGSIEVVKCLLNAGANIHAKSLQGYTALMAACINNHLDIVKLLVHRSNLEEVNNKGNTAFLEAADGYAADCMILLRNVGANLKATNNAGKTAIELAQDLIGAYNVPDMVYFCLINAMSEKEIETALSNGHLSPKKIERFHQTIAEYRAKMLKTCFYLTFEADGDGFYPPLPFDLIALQLEQSFPLWTTEQVTHEFYTALKEVAKFRQQQKVKNAQEAALAAEPSPSTITTTTTTTSTAEEIENIEVEPSYSSYLGFAYTAANTIRNVVSSFFLKRTRDERDGNTEAPELPPNKRHRL